MPVDLVVEVIPQFKTGHKGSWALRASVKHCCSSIKSWTSFLSRLFSCSRHSYSSCNSSALWVCFLRLLCAATRFFSLLFNLFSSSSELSLFRNNRKAGASFRVKLLVALKSDMTGAGEHEHNEDLRPLNWIGNYRSKLIGRVN